MSDKFKKLIFCIVIVTAIVIGITLSILGNMTEGWSGIFLMFVSLSIFILLMFFYNRRYK